jgi:hypothetical protein
MACTIKTPTVAQQRDIFKTIKESAQFKKAEGKLNEILTNGINVEKLMAEQKANGKKNLITRNERGVETDTVPLPDDFIEVKEVKVKKAGTNFFYRQDNYSVEEEDGVMVVITPKEFKEIKVAYTIEDTSEKRDLQTDVVKLQKFADAVKDGNSTTALKVFEDEIKKVTDAFDGVYNGIHQVIEKIRSDVNIPVPTSAAIAIVDKVKKHKGSNVINLEDPVSITRVQARKANTNFFFNLVQYKFIPDSGTVIADNLYEEYKVEYRGKGSSTANVASSQTGKLPTAGDITGDLNNAIASIGNVTGDIAREINNVAGTFGKDISGLLSSASSGSLINDALALANQQPSVYTIEKTVRDKATNAIALPGVSGGEAGVVLVETRREDQSYFTQMLKGINGGWRLEGENLYLPNVRAEVKVTYKQEIDPPVSSGVPSLSNDKDIPKCDPCRDLPNIGVEVLEQLKTNLQTGEVEKVVLKNKLNKPPPKKEPVIKAEPAAAVAENPTVIASELLPSSSLWGSDTNAVGQTLSSYGDLIREMNTKSNSHFKYLKSSYKAQQKEDYENPEFKTLVGHIKKNKYSAEGILNGEQGVGEFSETQIQLLQNYTTRKSQFQTFGLYQGYIKSLLFEQRRAIVGETTEDFYLKALDKFLNVEVPIKKQDNSNTNLSRTLSNQSEDPLANSKIWLEQMYEYQKSKKETLINWYKYNGNKLN